MSDVYVTAKVDVDDVLADLGMDELAKYLQHYGYRDRAKLAALILKDGAPDPRDDTLAPFVDEAIELLREGRADDALLLLERASAPKWKSPEVALLAVKARLADAHPHNTEPA